MTTEDIRKILTCAKGEKILDKLLDAYTIGWAESDDDITIETWAPNDADVVISLYPEYGPVWMQFENRAEGFDLDESVFMWLEAKRSGVDVPGVEELVEDGKWIRKTLYALARAFRKLEEE